jgi:hypothetical protein
MMVLCSFAPSCFDETRRHTHGVRGRAKPSMMIYVEVQKYFENLVNQILNMEHIPMELIAFVCDDVRAESNRSSMEHRSGAPYFLYAAMCVLKVIEVVWSVTRERVAVFYALVR